MGRRGRASRRRLLRSRRLGRFSRKTKRSSTGPNHPRLRPQPRRSGLRKSRLGVLDLSRVVGGRSSSQVAGRPGVGRIRALPKKSRLGQWVQGKEVRHNLARQKDKGHLDIESTTGQVVGPKDLRPELQNMDLIISLSQVDTNR